MNELKTEHKVLLIGIGNSGRSDDALGWKFIDELPDDLDLFDIEHRYQLQIEDALLLTEYRKVIFVDASHKTYEDGFSFYKCTPARTEAFTTHKLEPETVLWLANDLFHKSPEVYVMAISGIEWELRQGMSTVAQQNFEKAISYFKKWLTSNIVVSPVLS